MALRKISVAHQSNAEETFMNDNIRFPSPFSCYDENKENVMNVIKFNSVQRHPQGGMYWHLNNLDMIIVIVPIVILLLLLLFAALYMKQT